MGEPGHAATAARALSKATWRIVPLIGLGYGFAFIDRVNISFAAQTMNRDLHFSATIYGLGGGLFFLSYALFGVPSNLLLVKFGARRWLGALMIAWGLLATAMLFVRTPLEYYAVRFLLGVAEAGFFPGVITYLTGWFPAEARGRAISRFYVAWPLSNLVMGLFAGILLGLQGRLGLTGWQWLFLAEGLPAALMGIAIVLLLPDAIDGARWLSKAEKDSLSARLARDVASATRHSYRGTLRALLNPLVLGFTFVNVVMLSSYYAFNLSAPQILGEATHLSVATVGYVVAAGGLVGAIAMIFAGWHSDRSRERFLHLAFPLLLSGAGFAVLAVTSEAYAVIGAYWLVMAGNAGIAAVFWLAPGEVLPPRAIAITVAAMNSVGQLGSFVSAYLWGIAKDTTGGFHLGISLLPIGFVLAALVVLWLGYQAHTRRAADAQLEAAMA